MISNKYSYLSQCLLIPAGARKKKKSKCKKKKTKPVPTVDKKHDDSAMSKDLSGIQFSSNSDSSDDESVIIEKEGKASKLNKPFYGYLNGFNCILTITCFESLMMFSIRTSPLTS